MATEQTRNAVWQELLDVARLVRYYEVLSDRHRRNHSIVRFLLLAAAASGIAALLDVLPASVQLIAGGLVALLVVWDFIADYAKKATVLHALSLECSALEIEWRELHTGLWRTGMPPKRTINERGKPARPGKTPPPPPPPKTNPPEKVPPSKDGKK